MSFKTVTAILISVSLTAAAAAQERRLPTQSDLRLSYAPVVHHAAPAVVNVYAAKVVQNRNPLLDDPIFRKFFGVPGGGGNQLQRSLGSGVIIDAAGLVVTNNHVIEGADEVKVALPDKREFEATLCSRIRVLILRYCASTMGASGSRYWISLIQMHCKSAMSCSLSAIPLESGRL